MKNNNFQPMWAAPKDREVLVLARWDWDGMNDPDEKYSLRVASYNHGSGPSKDWEGWWSVTSNPYSDKAVDPIGWLPLPSSATLEAHSAASAADTLAAAEA